MAIVRLKNKTNGVTYVYESKSYRDKDKKQEKTSYKSTFLGLVRFLADCSI